MIELLTAIALWCGTSGTTDTINKCREELYFCATFTVTDLGVRAPKNGHQIAACFGKQKL